MIKNISIFILTILCVSLALPVTGGAYQGAKKPFKTAAAKTFAVSSSEDFQLALNAAKRGDVIKIEAGASLVGNFILPAKSASLGGSNGEPITIRTAASDDQLPPEGTRISPSYANAMAKLVTPNTEPAVRTEPGASEYRFLGIEFAVASDVMLNYGIIRLGEGNETDAAALPHDISIERCYIHGHAVGDVSRAIALNSASTDIRDSYISDIHGIGFDTQAICGWNGPGPFKIINNYLEAAGENVLFGGADPKVANLVPSDIEFRRNDCVKPLSWKEGILAKPVNITAGGVNSAGGALPPGSTYYYKVTSRGRAGYSTVATSVASDEIAVSLAWDQTAINLAWDATDHSTEYRVYRTGDAPDSQSRNWTYYTTGEPFFTDTADAASGASGSAPPTEGTRWSVKNLFELKNARRVVVDGNLFENNWVHAQSGFAIQLTPRNQDGKAPWSVIEDIEFTNNIVRHSAAGINILGKDDLHPSQQARRISIRNNLFYDIGGSQWGGNGRFLQITESMSVSLNHNTILHTGNIITAYGQPNIDFSFTNNLAPNNAFGVIGDGASSGLTTITKYLPLCSFKKNVIVSGKEAIYPKKNFFPASIDEVGFVDREAGNYRLSSLSQFSRAGTKDSDIGADIDEIEQARNKANADLASPEK